VEDKAYGNEGSHVYKFTDMRESANAIGRRTVRESADAIGRRKMRESAECARIRRMCENPQR
jgi:hypothetical protein